MTIEGILMETLHDTIKVLEGETRWSIPPRYFCG